MGQYTTLDFDLVLFNIQLCCLVPVDRIRFCRFSQSYSNSKLTPRCSLYTCRVRYICAVHFKRDFIHTVDMIFRELHLQLRRISYCQPGNALYTLYHFILHIFHKNTFSSILTMYLRRALLTVGGDRCSLCCFQQCFTICLLLYR